MEYMLRARWKKINVILKLEEDLSTCADDRTLINENQMIVSSNNENKDA